jgi:transcriptional regulator with XRE-family HTH domain
MSSCIVTSNEALLGISLLQNHCAGATIEYTKAVLQLSNDFAYLQRKGCQVGRITLQQIGPLLREKRGARPLREAAAEIGVSQATLSRIERGNLPDLETFPKICRWLGLNPGDVFGFENSSTNASSTDDQQAPVAAHFRAQRNISPDLAKALAELIVRVQQMEADEPSP